MQCDILQREKLPKADKVHKNENMHSFLSQDKLANSFYNAAAFGFCEAKNGQLSTQNTTEICFRSDITEKWSYYETFD